jgi:DNA-binding CsgD family transcriptional regulator
LSRAAGGRDVQNSLKLFSTFVSDMNTRARTEDVQGLARWAVKELSETIGFDCAWYGWAQVKPEGVEIHANSTLNLPDKYYESWCEISAQDLLAAGILENPGRASSYDRSGSNHTDGMVALSDKYGLKKMATAMHSRPGRVASFYLSGYRTGQTTRGWSCSELDFLQCAVDQISAAMKLSTTETDYDIKTGAVSIYVNENGIGILGLQNLKAQLGNIWPEWDGDRLPECLRALINQRGEHILVDRNILVRCEPASGLNPMGLHKLTLRRLTQFDLLTHRERAVACVLADGKSHKETARLLGVAPATIRNQTQSIYSKLGVDNRANLAAIVHKYS